MQTQNKPTKGDFSTLLLTGVILLIVSQALEGNLSAIAQFLRGVCLGLSMVACVVGLYLYAKK